MMSLARYTIGLLLLGCTTVVSAAEWVAPREGQIYLTPRALLLGEDDKNNIDGYLAPHSGLGFQLSDAFAIELLYGGGKSEIETGANVDVGIEQFRVDGIYNFSAFDGRAMRPYFATGIGRYSIQPSRGSDNDETQLNAGFGMMTAISERWRLRTDARVYYQTSAEEATPGVNVGVDYIFAGPVGPPDADNDGVSDPTDQCPGTPPGTQVDMNGCALDSDRDGVPDSSDACPDTPAGAPVDRRGCPLDSDRDGVPDFRDDCPRTPRGVEVDSVGCEVEVEPDVERMTLDMEFDFDSSTIRPTYYDDIEEVADYMREYPETRAQLEGHTDSIGTEAYNQALSERRAYSVRDYLIDEGRIDPRRITAVGHGESEPVATNETAAGRQENRRVEAVIDDGELSVRPRRD